MSKPRDDLPTEIDIPELHQVVVQCHNEAQQRSLYERLKEEGYKCRLLML
ncbi:MAG: hypothetical protein SGJ20_11480 [Planctomycetota bacterium]|nr:hypothetical protein [Planctomycetota bacterium]